MARAMPAACAGRPRRQLRRLPRARQTRAPPLPHACQHPAQLLERLWSEDAQGALGALQERVGQRLSPADQRELVERFSRLFDAVTAVGALQGSPAAGRRCRLERGGSPVCWLAACGCGARPATDTSAAVVSAAAGRRRCAAWRSMCRAAGRSWRPMSMAPWWAGWTRLWRAPPPTSGAPCVRGRPLSTARTPARASRQPGGGGSPCQRLAAARQPTRSSKPPIPPPTWARAPLAGQGSGASAGSGRDAAHRRSLPSAGARPRRRLGPAGPRPGPAAQQVSCRHGAAGGSSRACRLSTSLSVDGTAPSNRAAPEPHPTGCCTVRTPTLL